MWQIDKEALFEEMLAISDGSLAEDPIVSSKLDNLCFINLTYQKEIGDNKFAASDALGLLADKFSAYFIDFPFYQPNHSIFAREVNEAFSLLSEEVQTAEFVSLLENSHVPTNSFLPSVEEDTISLIKANYSVLFGHSDSSKSLVDPAISQLYRAVYFYSLLTHRGTKGFSLHLLPSSLAGIFHWPFPSGDPVSNRSLRVIDLLLAADSSKRTLDYADYVKYSFPVNTTQEVRLSNKQLLNIEVFKELVVSFSDKFKNLADLSKAASLLAAGF